MPQSIFNFTGANGSSISNELTVTGGAVEIQNNKAVSTTAAGDASYIYRDTGASDFDITEILSVPAGVTSASILFRYVSPTSYNHAVLSAGGILQLKQQNGTSSTSIGASVDVATFIPGYVAGDPVTIRAKGVGNIITVDLEGVERIPDTGMSQNLSSQLHGGRIAGPGSYIDYIAMEDLNPVTDAIVNTAPTANAGANGNIDTGQSTILNGSASSDPEGDSLTYAWTFTSVPSGSSAAFVDPAVENPTFTPDLDGNYTAQLIVNDGQLNSPPSTVTKTASTAVVTSTLNMAMEGVAVGSTAVYDTTITNTLTDVSRTEPISWTNEAATYTWPEAAGSTLMYVVIIPSAETDAGVQFGDTV